jgi:PAS domain S-box-containing protein
LLAAFEHAPSGVALIARDGTLLRANPALGRVLGRPAEELLGRRWQELIHPEDLPEGEAAVAGALRAAGRLDVEVRAVRPDGQEVWLRVTARPLAAGSDNPAALVAHYEDVTDRRSREQDVALLAAVVAGVPDAVVVADRHHRVVFLNEAAERLYGVSSADAAGRTIFDAFVHPDEQDAARAWGLRLGDATTGVHARLSRHRRADGTAFDAEVTTSPVHDAEGRLVGVGVLVRDVTARLEQQADAAALRAVVDAAAEAIVGIDEHDVVRSFSPSAERIYGWRAEEIVGRPVWELVPEERRAAGRATSDDLVAGRRVRRETVALRNDGSTTEVSLTASPIFDRDGRYAGAAMTALDISDRRRAELEADRSRRLLQRMVDHAPAIMWFKDREGRILLVNRLGAAAIGREVEDVVGRTSVDLFPPEFAERAEAEDRHVLATGESMTYERDVPRPGGGELPTLTTKFPIFDSDGRPYGVGIIASDLSDVRRAEADRAQLGALVQAAADAIIVKDAEGTIVTWNPAAEEMFGLTAEEAVGRDYEDVVVAPAEIEAYRRMHEQVCGGEILNVRMSSRRADGSLFPTQLSVAPLPVPGGRPGIIAIIRDISDLVEAQRELQERAAQLERSNADLEGFAYAASHDLQEPLRSIMLGTESVLRAAAQRLEDDERGVLEHVDAAASQMSVQVGALMQAAQVEVGPPPEDPVPVELALEDAVTSLRAAIEESDARIEVEGELPAAAVPREELAIVLQNVIGNAIRFRRPGVPPRIVLSGSAGEGHAEVCVADNGSGLSGADLTRIFGFFQRARSDVPGTGMGLAVCRRILERREGAIRASSAGPGRGAEFTLRLPVAPAQRPASSATASAAAGKPAPFSR